MLSVKMSIENIVDGGRSNPEKEEVRGEVVIMKTGYKENVGEGNMRNLGSNGSDGLNLQKKVMLANFSPHNVMNGKGIENAGPLKSNHLKTRSYV